MAEPNLAHLKTAFVDPIRFALLLDDQFPVYPCRPEDGKTAGDDYERAAKLFAFCRERGWLCDVENGVEKVREFEHDKHLHQSNLLVLDYHLDETSKEDSSGALGIIQKLAKSPHFNLVIVYTLAEIDSVARDVACALGARGFGEERHISAARDAVESADDEVQDRLDQAVNGEFLDLWLQRVPAGDTGKALRKVVTSAAIGNDKIRDAVLAVVARRRVEDRLEAKILAAKPPAADIEARFGKERDVLWVTRDKVFVAIVNKRDEPKMLEERLLSALADWNPSPLRVMTVHARAELERAGAIADQTILGTPLKQAGWLLGVLLAPESDKRTKIEQLYGRLYEKFTRNVSTDAINFAREVIGDAGAEGAVGRAKALGGMAADADPAQVYHSLNEYLSSDRCPDGPMTTGVVFKASIQGGDHFWLCTSPACDLVPDQNREGWENALKPMRPMTAAKLSRDKLVEQLLTATHGRGLYLTVDDEPISFQVIDPVKRQMQLETIILAGEGLIEGGRFRAHRVVKEGDEPRFIPMDCEVLALLRPEYANRLLADAGQQRSRIGVDFIAVDLEKAKKESAT